MNPVGHLTDEELDKFHDGLCARALGDGRCGCLVEVVKRLQRELEGRFGWRIVPDAAYRNAVTLLTPGGRKLRITDYEDGRVRLRIAQAGPMVLQECYLNGRGQDVLLTVAPEGHIKGQEATHAGV